jgi:septum formation topological specificity factor MinE
MGNIYSLFYKKNSKTNNRYNNINIHLNNLLGKDINSIIYKYLLISKNRVKIMYESNLNHWNIVLDFCWNELNKEFPTVKNVRDMDNHINVHYYGNERNYFKLN